MIRFFLVFFLLFSTTSYSQSVEERIRKVYDAGNTEIFRDTNISKKRLREAIAIAEAKHLDHLRIEGKWRLIAIDAYYATDFKVLDECMQLCREENLTRRDSAMVLRFLSDAGGLRNVHNLCKKIA